ncbi:MAG: DUF3179 domain-containing protein [Pseudomonadota bacterium]
MHKPIAIAALVALAGLAGPAAGADQAALDTEARAALSSDRARAGRAIEWLVGEGGEGAIAPLIQIMRWRFDHRERIAAGLEKMTGARPGPGWFEWMVWQQTRPEIKPYPGYTGFFADLLASIDPEFRRFVRAGIAHVIRIEEIAWGGVRVDGIPALDNPQLIAAAEAAYLNPDDLVFGVAIGGDVRAYPLRIANWHEMVNDVVGGVPVSLAYCTLCGAGILFDGRGGLRAQPFTFGSSGLLYRSNKLMFDRQTDSLWNHFTGRPVVGRLVGSGIELKVLPMVIAQWSDWKRRHPTTKVLSLDTGHIRDYGSGVAYRDYFASPDLMFPALIKDRRLDGKDMVFGLRAPGGAKAWPLHAFAGGKVIIDQVGLIDVVLIGEDEGRSVRAYEARGLKFSAGADPRELRRGDEIWRVSEAALIGPDGRTLPRLPGHVAFWFAWAGYFDEAELGQAGR